jgi:hypothetical protein
MRREPVNQKIRGSAEEIGAGEISAEGIGAEVISAGDKC